MKAYSFATLPLVALAFAVSGVEATPTTVCVTGGNGYIASGNNDGEEIGHEARLSALFFGVHPSLTLRVLSSRVRFLQS